MSLRLNGDDAYMGKILCERAEVAQAIYDFLIPQVGRLLKTIAVTEFLRSRRVEISIYSTLTTGRSAGGRSATRVQAHTRNLASARWM